MTNPVFNVVLGWNNAASNNYETRHYCSWVLMTNFSRPVELRFDPSKKCMSPPKLHCKKQLVFDWYWICQLLSNSALEIASITVLDFLTIEYCARLHLDFKAASNNYETRHRCSRVLETIINVKRWTQQIFGLPRRTEPNLTPLSNLNLKSVS